MKRICGLAFNARLRRAQPRGMRRRAHALEHPAASARAAQRPDLRRVRIQV